MGQTKLLKKKESVEMDMVTFSMLLKTFMKYNILGLTRLCSAIDLIHLVFFL